MLRPSPILPKMDLTPQSARSPSSPYRYTSSHQQLYEYPSPAQSDSRYRSTDSLQGLGLYSCPIPGSNVESGGSMQSPPATNNWPTGDLHHRDTPRSTQSTPNILSAEYDPFAPFHPAVSAAPYSNDIYSSQPAEVSILPASPAPSGNTSQRSSFSSAPASEIFTQAGSTHSYTPRIKMEDHPDFVSGHEGIIMSSPQLSHNIIVTSASSYPGSLETTFYHEPSVMGWPKVEYTTTQDLPSLSSLPLPPYDRRSESLEGISSGLQGQRRRPSTIARTRQPRKLTTKEDANFQCSVSGCGKLFGRSYNFKAHMETHDAGREYPFPCPIENCSKKFVRKTDLQRHHQSVHMKQRNHRCDYCNRFFARKDTLRRHMEDGCAKRFDIETVDFRPQNYDNGDHSSMRIASRASENQSRQPSYSSSSHYTPPPASHGTIDSSLVSSSGAYLERQEFIAGEGGQEPWNG
ncbi:hypothetical protein ONS95_005602 [Cadophora gregata]|uniref:uncharacterized protein n=1 Tax=Cadophora gregata TaxID=51156 RepID=UPI0026DCCD40|nr:uncharacterized protein ONS95_005602 [Cadophora gregata]KAK0103589.1 hypothetical protein ONS95_005602 [Cadophora gregata]KAK0107782.1 hypothetical protein ONS96_003575 [Cadophora gregata f. sp. sojae]